MKKFLAIFALLIGAATGAYSGEWNGSGSTSSGTHTDGGNASFNRVVANQLVSTGTAPSLTATGGVFKSSITVVSPGDDGQIGALTVVNNSGSLGQQIKFRHIVASSLKTFGYDNNYGAFLFSDNDAGDSITATSMLQVTRLGLMRISDAASYLSYPVPGARLHVTSTGTIKGILVDGASANPFTIGTSTLVVNGDTGNLGIGTASPASKLHVSGDTSLQGVTTVSGSSLTVTGANPSIGIGVQDGGAGGGAIEWGGGYASPSAPNTESDGDKLDFYKYPGRTQKFVQGVCSGAAGCGMFFQSQPFAGNAMTWWTEASGAATAPTQKMALSEGGDFGVGVGVTKASATAAGYFRHPSKTIVQLLAITPGAVGEQAFCNNCSPAKMVVSTGTSAGNWADIMGGAFQ